MVELKTKPTDQNVNKFIESVADKQKREDAKQLLKLFTEVTKEKPVMWGPSMIGFGLHHYRYASGREADWLAAGFSPRKQNLTLYLTYDVSKLPGLNNLGKFTTGKGCIYIKKLADVDQKALKKLIAAGYKLMKNTDSSNP